MAEPIRLIIDVDDQGTPVVRRFAQETERQFNRAAESTVADNRRMEQSFAQTRGSVLTATTAFRAFTGVALAIGSSRIVQSIIQTAVQIDSLERSMRALTGSTEAAQFTLNFVRREAERLGLDSLEAANGMRRLINATRGTALEGQRTREIFSALSEATIVLGLSTDEYSRALLAVSQIALRGRVQQEELNQLAEAGIPVQQQLATALGKTGQELQKMLQQGEITSEALIPLFRQVRTELGEGVADAAESARSNIARFNNAIRELGQELGQILLPILTLIAKELTAILQVFRRAPDPVEEFRLAMGAAAREIEKQVRTLPQLNQELEKTGQQAETIAEQFERVARAGESLADTVEQQIALDALGTLGRAMADLEDDMAEAEQSVEAFEQAQAALARQTIAGFRQQQRVAADALQEQQRVANQLQQIRQRVNRDIEREQDESLRRQEQQFESFRENIRDTLQRLFEDPDRLFSRGGLQDFFGRLGASLASEFLSGFLAEQIGPLIGVNRPGQSSGFLSRLLGGAGQPQPGQTDLQQFGALLASSTVGGPTTPLPAQQQQGVANRQAILTGAAIIGAGVASGVIRGEALLIAQDPNATPGEGAQRGATEGLAIGSAFGPQGAAIGAASGAAIGAIIAALTRKGPARITTRTAAQNIGFEGEGGIAGPFGFVGLDVTPGATRRVPGRVEQEITRLLVEVDQLAASILTASQEELARTALQRSAFRTSFRTFDDEAAEILLDRFSTILDAVAQESISETAFRGIAPTLENVTLIQQRFEQAANFLVAIEELADPRGPLTQTEQVLEALEEQFADLRAEAIQFGVGLDRIDAALANQRRQLLEGFEQSIEQQILAITDPLAAAMEQLRILQEDRLREAEALGADIARVLELNRLEMEQILETQATDVSGIRSFLRSLEAGSASPLPVGEQLRNAEAAFEAQRTAALAGELDQQALLATAQTLIDVSRERFASSALFFDRLNFVTATLENIIAAETARDPALALLESIEENTADAQTSNEAVVASIQAMQAELEDVNARLNRVLTRLTA